MKTKLTLLPAWIVCSVALGLNTIPAPAATTFSDANWTTLGSGMNNRVMALAVSGSDLYAGGYFTNAGGSAANYVGKWDGSSWSALGSGLGGGYLSYSADVSALAVTGSDLYAGGLFTTATNSGGVAVTVNGVAKWDGNSWSALGSGMGASYPFVPFVNALAVAGTNLYAGGDFTTATNSDGLV